MNFDGFVTNSTQTQNYLWELWRKFLLHYFHKLCPSPFCLLVFSVFIHVKNSKFSVFPIEKPFLCMNNALLAKEVRLLPFCCWNNQQWDKWESVNNANFFMIKILSPWPMTNEPRVFTLTNKKYIFQLFVLNLGMKIEK